MKINFKRLLLKAFFLTALLLITAQINVQQVSATCPPKYDGRCGGGCTYINQCINNKVCLETFDSIEMKYYLTISSKACGSTVIGGVAPPQGVVDYNIDAAIGGGQIGALLFASRILKIFTIVSGIWVMANFIIGGIEFISTAGTSETMAKVNKRLTYSLVGIVLIASAYTMAGILGLIFFGDAGFILNPDIEQYGALAP